MPELRSGILERPGIENRQKPDRSAGCRKLSGHLEGDMRSFAETTEEARTLRQDRSQIADVCGSERFILLLSVKPIPVRHVLKLQAIHRLIGPKAARQEGKPQRVDVRSSDAEQRWQRSRRLDRDERLPNA